MGFWWSCSIFNFLHRAILKRLSIAPIIHYLYLFFSPPLFSLSSPAEQVVFGCWWLDGARFCDRQPMYGRRIGPAASYIPHARCSRESYETNHPLFGTQFIAEVWSKFTENLHCSLIKQSLWGRKIDDDKFWAGSLVVHFFFVAFKKWCFFSFFQMQSFSSVYSEECQTD